MRLKVTVSGTQDLRFGGLGLIGFRVKVPEKSYDGDNLSLPTESSQLISLTNMASGTTKRFLFMIVLLIRATDIPILEEQTCK